MRAWVILFLAIASEVVGTVALKYAVDHFWIYGVAALCFILAFVLLHLSLIHICRCRRRG